MIIFFLSLLLPLFTLANEPASAMECTVRVIAEDIQAGYGEATFEVPLNGGGHGGEERTYSFAPYEVTTIADGKWMGLSWWRGEELIAEGIFVVTAANIEARVAIMYDPKNRENQVAMDCAPKAEKPPVLKRSGF